MSRTWITIIIIMLAATLSGCAKDASGDDHKDEMAVTSDTTTADEEVSAVSYTHLTLPTILLV